MDRQLRVLAAVLVVALAGGAAILVSRLGTLPAPAVEMAGYSTPLTGRSPSQRHNARLSARALNGTIVAAGETFSFNRTVRSWTVDRGYVKAPVSYDGELVRAFGGGVCQTSTTLYNAALLAGLDLVERNSHVFAPSYVAPGRDAAVAQYDIDLKIRNPYPWPITIRASVVGERLEIRILGSRRPTARIEVTTVVLAALPPARLTMVLPSSPRGNARTSLRSAGAIGFRVVSYRTFFENDHVIRREVLADDTYQAMNRIVALRQAQAP
jgi:vancomycin resistance protein YoaR